MGPYCKFCDRRCFVERVLRDGRTMLLATCMPGMQHDRDEVGEDFSTARNPNDRLTINHNHEDCDGCICCSRLGCRRGPDSDCAVDEGRYLCPCTED